MAGVSRSGSPQRSTIAALLVDFNDIFSTREVFDYFA